MRTTLTILTTLAAVAVLAPAAAEASPGERGAGDRARTTVTVLPYDDFVVRGRLDSPRAACERRRTVVLRGADLADDTVRTSRRGTFRFEDALAAWGARIVVRAPATRSCAAGVGRYRVPLPEM